MHITEGHPAERFSHELEESTGFGGIRAARMGTNLERLPEFNQAGVIRSVGRWLDGHYNSGVFCTAPLLMLGAALGCWSAWKWMQGQ